MSVGSNPTPGVDFSNEQEELLLEMEEEVMELLKPNLERKALLVESYII